MKLNVKICKKLLYSTLISGVIFSTVSHAQGLLDKLNVQDKNPLDYEIYEQIIEPLIDYDEKAVTVRVLDDLSIFQGHNEYLRHENANYNGKYEKIIYDADKDIYRVLNAQGDNLLLQFNVEVTLTPDFIQKTQDFLTNNNDRSYIMDGTQEYLETGDNKEKDFTTRFYMGSIKGKKRKRTYSESRPYKDVAQIFQKLGFQNSFANFNHSYTLPEERRGVAFAHPYETFQFGKGTLNGVLCKSILKLISEKRNLEGVSSMVGKPELPNFALSGAFFREITPRLRIKFHDSNNEIIFEDFIENQRSSVTLFSRGTSMGRRSAVEATSMLSIDPLNGWHEQDRYLSAHMPGKLAYQMLSTHLMRNLVIHTAYPRSCEFGISHQTNFSVISKVSKDLLAKTTKISASMFYHSVYPRVFVKKDVVHLGTSYSGENSNAVLLEYKTLNDGKVHRQIVIQGENIDNSILTLTW